MSESFLGTKLYNTKMADNLSATVINISKETFLESMRLIHKAGNEGSCELEQDIILAAVLNFVVAKSGCRFSTPDFSKLKSLGIGKRIFHLTNGNGQLNIKGERAGISFDNFPFVEFSPENSDFYSIPISERN